MTRVQLWLVIGALLGGLAVVMGAFGAHGLQGYFAGQGISEHEVARRLANWETAARYQMYHALALLAVGLLAARRAGVMLDLAASAMTLGTLIFSGCLYVLVLTGVRGLGAVVPIGGVLMVVGWGCLSIAVLSNRENRS